MKCMTRALAQARYGYIDFASKHWTNQGIWLRPVEVPSGWFPNWHVMDTKMLVSHIVCNIDLHGPLLKALESLHNRGLGNHLKNFAGAFNIRMVRGSNTHFSAHSYGLALDINTHDNPLGSTHGGFYDEPGVVACFKEQGFDWGGDFHGRKDPMHFSYCWE